MEWSNELWLSIIGVGFLAHSVMQLIVLIHLLKLGRELRETWKEMLHELWSAE